MTLDILCHDGSKFEVTVDSFDPIATNEILNDPNILTIVIGDIIFSRIDIKRIVPKI
jgi:hypothetical protein